MSACSIPLRLFTLRVQENVTQSREHIDKLCTRAPYLSIGLHFCGRRKQLCYLYISMRTSARLYFSAVYRILSVVLFICLGVPLWGLYTLINSGTHALEDTSDDAQLFCCHAFCGLSAGHRFLWFGQSAFEQ